MIKIKAYQLSDILLNDKILFNTNNHYIAENVPQPDDYREVINKMNTSNWIDLFHINYSSIILDKYDLAWMQKAFNIGSLTGKFPHIFDDELKETCSKYSFPENLNGWFVRTDKVSLKEGKYGTGPYFNLEDIIISMISTRNRHRCFEIDDEICPIFFLPWKNMKCYKEFRIFVHDNVITAISQQNIYKINVWLNKLGDEKINKIIQSVIIHFNDKIKHKLLFTKNCVIDFIITEDGEYYLIELNPFGKYYASGSALFQWQIDYDLLYGKKKYIEFRYVK